MQGTTNRDMLVGFGKRTAANKITNRLRAERKGGVG
jgi:hypothetical protein